ncbi:MAG: DUF3479 domain-containing protein [Burkholderiaceae bacterium]|nr:DUF3479 domain-containing protein [Burkholderiaceae bacterium]
MRKPTSAAERHVDRRRARGHPHARRPSRPAPSSARGRAAREHARARRCRCTPPPNGTDDPGALARCQTDIAIGDIIIVTMMFMEDHMQAVLPALRARRDQCDAMICCMSAGEVVQADAHGPFRHGRGRESAARWRC